MVEAGHKGVKSGIGFYDYNKSGKDKLIPAERFI
jgi:3-hydroxybutyryl-CoA dehydrogenase